MEKTNNISLFAVSFRQGFLSPNVPIATFSQGNKKLNFLLDSGTDHNVIDKSVLSDIEYEIVNGSQTTFTGVGGTQSVSNSCNIAFSCDDKQYTANFFILDMSESFNVIQESHSIVLHGIIGSKFFRDNNIVLDFRNLAAYSKA